MPSILQAFDPRIIGLTGSRQAVDDIIDGYRVFARKVPEDGLGYTMDHTATASRSFNETAVVVWLKI